MVLPNARAGADLLIAFISDSDEHDQKYEREGEGEEIVIKTYEDTIQHAHAINVQGPTSGTQRINTDTNTINPLFHLIEVDDDDHDDDDDDDDDHNHPPHNHHPPPHPGWRRIHMRNHHFPQYDKWPYI